MQFTYLALFSLISLALASPIQIAGGDLVERQTTQTQPPAEVAAMSDASGNVVTFDAAAVFTPSSK